MKSVLTGFIITCLMVVFFSAALSAAERNDSSDNKDARREIYKSETLEIHKISDHVYQHISFLNTNDWGKVPCNGMIVVDSDEAIIFDTPADEQSSMELIGFLEDSGNKIKGVIATHFHGDCVAGLKEFHTEGIRSFAGNKTITILKEKKADSLTPKSGFDEIELKVGDKIVRAEYFGEGHTKDNIVGYFPEEKIMFGGCLIKSYGAGKGNLEDANVKEWANTVRKLKQKYPDVRVVIPGHGNPGGIELLDFTAELFEK